MLLRLLGSRRAEPLCSDLCPVLRPCACSVDIMTVVVSGRVCVASTMRMQVDSCAYLRCHRPPVAGVVSDSPAEALVLALPA